MNIKIEKVENGFLLTKNILVPKQQEFAYLSVMPSSYRTPMEVSESKIVFEKWNDLQAYIRKFFGVAE